MTEALEIQAQELAKFAQEQNFDERYLEYFGDVWREAGVEDISKMTIKDAERTMQVLSSSEASVEFVKAFYAQAVRQVALLQFKIKNSKFKIKEINEV